MVRLLTPLAALLLAPLGAFALHLAPVALSVSSSTGSVDFAHQLVAPASLAEPIALADLSVLKLAVEVLDADGGKGVAPHQAGLSFVECVHALSPRDARPVAPAADGVRWPARNPLPFPLPASSRARTSFSR